MKQKLTELKDVTDKYITRMRGINNSFLKYIAVLVRTNGQKICNDTEDLQKHYHQLDLSNIY